MKEIDPYNRAFSDSVDFTDKIGERIGFWLRRGGWKIVMIISTTLAIAFFGFIQLFHGFGKGLLKKH